MNMNMKKGSFYVTWDIRFWAAFAGIFENISFLIFWGQSYAVGRKSHHYTVSSEYSRPAHLYSLSRFVWNLIYRDLTGFEVCEIIKESYKDDLCCPR
jgi:hypothetical protein